MKKTKHYLSLGGLMVLMASCLTQQPYHPGGKAVPVDAPESELRYSFFLIGESYRSSVNQAADWKLLHAQLQEAGDKGVALWMGNNTNRRGLPDDKYHNRRVQAEAAIAEKVELVKNFEGPVIMIPGYNDWDAGGHAGYANVLNLEEFIQEELMNERNVVVPDNACPGPVEIDISDDLLL
ncbi:MAG: hypothetical protein OER04_17385, partial [Cyclobacteriaceae bacterium]|nr:hypothetical protein [Cyclobacteriaceae bacterium]